MGEKYSEFDAKLDHLEDIIKRRNETLALINEANEETRTIIREAHETIKTVKLTLRELREEHDRWANDIKQTVDDALARQVKTTLEQYHDDIRTATSQAHESVIKEFEKLTNLMMYGNEKGQKGKNNSPLIEDWIVKMVREEMKKNKGPIRLRK